jgi:hypothetical protein
MPVIKGSGPLPPDHPFAGTRIIFDAAMRRAAERQRALGVDPMRQAVDTVEQFLQDKVGDRYLPPAANDLDD